MYFICFYRVNINGNWTYLVQENLRPGAKINTIFRLSWKSLNRIIIRTF